MRVLISTDTVGGVWTYALDLTEGLSQLGVEVVLAAVGPTISQTQRDAARRADVVAFEFFAADLEWMAEPWNDVDASGRWLAELADDHEVDLLHSNFFSHGALALELPRLVVGHSCVCSWFEAVRGEPAPSSFDRYRARVRAGLGGADVVVAPSQAMMRALERHHGPLGRTRVIANGRAPEPFTARRKEPFVLTAGRIWDPAKNVGALASIAGRLRWPVRVAGPLAAPGDPGAACYEGLAMLGPLRPAELAGQMGRASIYALPARYEPFGLSALEAALCRCALVLGDIDSLREVWGDAAIFVPPEDPHRLREAIEGLIADAPRRVAMAERAFQRARTMTARSMAAAYFELYGELMDRCAGRARPPRLSVPTLLEA